MTSLGVDMPEIQLPHRAILGAGHTRATRAKSVSLYKKSVTGVLRRSSKILEVSTILGLTHQPRGAIRSDCATPLCTSGGRTELSDARCSGSRL